MRRVLALLPVLVFLALASGLYLSIFRGDPSEIPSALIGKPVPAMSLPPVPGSGLPGLSSEDLSGVPRVLNVWASWCAPCKIEHPQLMALSRMPGVEVVGINYKDTASAADRFLRQLGNPFTRIGFDPENKASINLGVYGVPETFLVDRHGVLRYRHVGPLTNQDLEQEILPRLKALEEAE